VAFGTADYLVPPMLRVQGRRQGLYGNKWMELGRVVVYNSTEVEARATPYVLTTPYPLEEVRFTLIDPPAAKAAPGAFGLGAEDREFCAEGDSTCLRTAGSSRAKLGYGVGRTGHELRKACADYASFRNEDPTRCKYSETAIDYMPAGNTTVAVLRVAINGKSMPVTSNNICSYEGSSQPLAGARAKQIYFGKPESELSNARRVLYPTATQTTEVIPFAGRTFALLNCNLNLESLTGTQLAAEVVYDASTVPFPDLRNLPAGQRLETASGSAKAFETANECYVESGPVGLEIRPPCYEIELGARTNAMTEDEIIFKSLEFQDFTMFGWD